MRPIFLALIGLILNNCTGLPMNHIRCVDQLDIGGLAQGIAVSGDPAKPALLILHGGGLALPGVASKTNYPLLSENFLLVFWDQRGAGRSTSSELDANNMGIDNFISDVQELTEYIKTQYSKEKIYLLGHSWGSMLGLRSVVEHPENYYGYVGVSQQLHVPSSDQLVYRDLRAKAITDDNKSMARKLEELGPPPYALEQWLALRELVARSGGLVSGEGEIGLIGMLGKMFGSYLGNPDYALLGAFRVQRNMNFVMSHTYPDMLAFDMSSINSLEVPVVLFHGSYDLNSHPDIAREWFDKLNSRDKTWVSFDDSAHMPMWEESEKFQAELVRLLVD